MATVLVPGFFVGFFGLPVFLGSEQNDQIFLTPGEGANAEILLLNGNDSLQSPNINDRLLVNGNAGSDTITGGFNTDTLFGGTDDDRIFANSGSDQVFGNVGNDVIEGGFNGDTLYGGRDNDNLFGDEGNDALFGDLGNDLLDGDGDRDDLFGGLGDDTFVIDPAEASRDFIRVDFIGDFQAGNTASVGDKIAMPDNFESEIDERSLERNIDINQDGRLDIAIQLDDGRFVGVLLDSATAPLPERLDLDIDFIFSDSFDFA
ncbi:MAG: calcium-binding protein [Oscillatoriales cyanobacterium RM1_1_9]|nr:calcium-binding protein [Oscillatoriales cyanobacterium SM2_3_0]NJO46871.1 calcium-binding protein [Oscillatoriales cyanobacterium RM2_1_1]NJO71557.1 calcium-binding protein [Oscillatoriales cyanobacterium RM1_1_9]